MGDVADAQPREDLPGLEKWGLDVNGLIWNLCHPG